MNKTGKITIVVVLAAVVAVVFVMKKNRAPSTAGGPSTTTNEAAEQPSTGLPRLLDLGAKSCIPCKMMAPILQQLRTEYEGRMKVEFIDVWEHPAATEKHGIKMIPTQIFFDASGKELFRRVGFISKEDILATWERLGVKFHAPAGPGFSRLDPAVPDTRPGEKVCYMCDGDVDPRTRATWKTDKGDVIFCSPHCYFITYSSLLDKKDADKNVFVTDWTTGEQLAATSATCLRGIDDSGRPTTKALSGKESAFEERRRAGGNILTWQMLKSKELSHRCGFCDRVVYPEDAALVKADGLYTWGCCPMCALGVAARTRRDVEIEQKDALTGETVRVKVANGSVSSLEPPTSVAWAGKKKNPEGKLVSGGCFKQAMFANEANLRKWVELNPTATGMMVGVHKALAAKMELTPQQIMKACKIGECVPR